MTRPHTILAVLLAGLVAATGMVSAMGRGEMAGRAGGGNGFVICSGGVLVVVKPAPADTPPATDPTCPDCAITLGDPPAVITGVWRTDTRAHHTGRPAAERLPARPVPIARARDPPVSS